MSSNCLGSRALKSRIVLIVFVFVWRDINAAFCFPEFLAVVEKRALETLFAWDRFELWYFQLRLDPHDDELSKGGDDEFCLLCEDLDGDGGGYGVYLVVGVVEGAVVLPGG